MPLWPIVPFKTIGVIGTRGRLICTGDVNSIAGAVQARRDTASRPSERRVLHNGQAHGTRSVCRASGFVVCWACSAAWRCKSSGQPDGGEGLVMMQGLPPRGGV